MSDTHPYRLTCPSCGQHFKVSPKAAGQSLACPKCSATIKVGQVAPKEQKADEPARRSFAEAAAATTSPASDAPTTEAPDQPVLPRVVQSSKAVKPSVIHQEKHRTRVSNNPRHARYLVYYGIWFGPLAVWFFVGSILYGIDTGGPLSHIAGGGCCLTFLWTMAGRFIAPLVTPRILASRFSHVRCPGCGELHDLVSQWSCGCGFNDHRERHALSFRCPACGGGVGYMNCPHCDVTILF